jgi:hypothetical protein
MKKNVVTVSLFVLVMLGASLSAIASPIEGFAKGRVDKTYRGVDDGKIGSLTTLKQTSGKLNVLRVHDVGTRYGPPTDQINVEVVITLKNKPGYAFGFQLRNDQNQPVRQGMLDLLRDAFNNNWTVTIDYEIANGKKNGVIRRTWLTR